MDDFLISRYIFHEDTISSYRLVSCATAGAWRRYAIYGRFPKCYGTSLALDLSLVKFS